MVTIIGHRNMARFWGWLIRDIIAAGHRVVAIGSDEPGVAQAITGLGAEFRPLSLRTTGLNPVRDLKDLGSLAALVRELRPDIVVTHGTKSNVIGVLAAKVARVGEVFVVVEGLGYAFAGGRELRRLCLRALLCVLFAGALRFARAILVMNPDDGRVIRRLGLERRSRPVVRIEGTGIDLEEFSYAPPVAGPLNVLMIARLLREKGVVEYAAASQRLRDQGTACRMDLLGPYDSNPGAIDEDQVNAWIAECLINYLGETDDVRPYLRACSILCLPSYREGLPRTVLEALAIGRPIITTDVPGCRELVIDGVNGFIVPPRDPDALAAAITRFVDRPELLVTMAQASRALAEARYNVGDINPLIMATMGLSAPPSSPHCGQSAQEPKWRR
ncbi:MAG: glycosyltransferase family 4 protein [Defluviicoccus sp.]|nr:glycosyltransferase family 4 protein [Defluviicoccus sp.]MDS4010537.1 glycosyltransferase family 4 protein [Defluviicoccus sp.]MDS4073034.1 glycosyltransferase family 4 protein [Defluviicoccus sp.]